MQHLPDTGQIMLPPVACVCVCVCVCVCKPYGNDPMGQVWRIRLLHLSRTEAQYLLSHLVEGVPWEDVWATVQQVAQPAAEGFVGMTGEGFELYDAVCP